ncbi:MAG: hypothetical protein JHC93_01715 [Parachlamydiales bacterium]|nr:hypothetical protein [Parachlamydiales bacterium]
MPINALLTFCKDSDLSKDKMVWQKAIEESDNNSLAHYLDDIYQSISRNVVITQLDYIEKLRQFTAFVFLCFAKEKQQEWAARLIHAYAELNTQTLWHDYQVVNAYLALNAHLLQQTVKLIDPKQYPSGMSPCVWTGHLQSANLPQPVFHAETGAVWALYAKLCHQDELMQNAIKLANWQLNTLDGDAEPFVSLYTQEKDASYFLHVKSNYLLFQTIARLCALSQFEEAALKQLPLLQNCLDEGGHYLDPLFLLFCQILENWPIPPKSSEFLLPHQIRDDYTALIGHRFAHTASIATLIGGQTGLGSYHYKDIKVTNFGPQFLPLGQCDAFGIEKGCSLHNKNPNAIVLDSTNTGYRIKGTVPLVSVSKNNFSGTWMDVEQKCDEKGLDVQIEFLGVASLQNVAFCFYVSAQDCLIDQNVNIRPLSLDRYCGPCLPVVFHSGDRSLMLSSLSGSTTMEVIPLAGGDNFWCADFLIAYHISEDLKKSLWQIRPNE